MNHQRVIPTELAKFMQQVIQGPVEITLNDLIRISGNTGEHALDAAMKVSDLLDSMAFTSAPEFNRGDFNTVRVITYDTHTQISVVNDEISAGESGRLEYKSSLHCDKAKLHHNPTFSPQDCKSVDVLHSSLKTIAAFLCCDGGTLLVGVQNDRTVCGLSDDILIITSGLSSNDTDKWELNLRDCIQSKFDSGSVINDYVSVEFHEISSKIVSRISVAKRNRLSFINKDSRYRLYSRQGCRTVEVEIHNIEDFLESRTLTM